VPKRTWNQYTHTDIHGASAGDPSLSFLPFFPRLDFFALFLFLFLLYFSFYNASLRGSARFLAGTVGKSCRQVPSVLASDKSVARMKCNCQGYRKPIHSPLTKEIVFSLEKRKQGIGGSRNDWLAPVHKISDGMPHFCAALAVNFSFGIPMQNRASTSFSRAP
jgi:hypothetical protein